MLENKNDELIKNLANNLFNEIKNKMNFYITPIIITPNLKIEEQLKYLWLNDDNGILMNVSFKRLKPFFLEQLSNENRYRLANNSDFRVAIAKVLEDPLVTSLMPDNIKRYIYDKDKYHPIKFYDYITKMVEVFNEYESELYDVSDSFQNILYRKSIEYLQNNGLTTLRNLFEDSNIIPNDNPVYIFGFSKLDKLSKEIINKLSISNNIKVYETKESEKTEAKITFSSCPSILREVEVMHSHICSLLREKNVKYSDFLVLAPNITNYQSTINRVFNQDDKNYPKIPYNFLDMKKEDSSFINALSRLMDIITRKTYTRYDIYELLSNKLIQKARDITSDDALVLMQCLVNMNAYRNHEEKLDFEYAKKRMLLSKLINNNITVENKGIIDNHYYLPFSNISLSDDVIVKFNDLIDDLSSLIKNLNKDILTSEYFDAFIEEMNKWLFVTKNQSSLENVFYKNLLKEINKWKYSHTSKVLVKTFIYAILDATSKSIMQKGTMFTSGVTFTNLNDDANYTSKYIFMLGMSSKNYPSKKSRSELFLNIKEDTSIKDGCTIVNKLISNAKEVFISYVNVNLTTLEEYFPSEAVSNYITSNNITTYKLDEDRKWGTLYTKLEYMNKGYYTKLLEEDEDNIRIEDEGALLEQSKKMKLKDLEEFLKDPFVHHLKRLFEKTDDYFEKIKSEYEPFSLDNIQQFNIYNKIATSLLKNENPSDVFNSNKELNTMDYTLHSGKIGEIEFQKEKEKAIKIKDDIISKYGQSLVVTNLNDLEIDLIINNQSILKWTIEYDGEFVKVTSGNDIKYALINDNSVNEIRLYLISLVDVASDVYEDKEYNIFINGREKCDYTLTKKEAIHYLNSIYFAYYDFDNIYSAPFSMVKGNANYDKYKDFIYNIQNSSAWKYFEHRDMIDFYKDLSYNESNYLNLWKEIRERQKSLMKFLEVLDDKQDR